MDVFEIDENKLYKTATWLGVGLRCLTPLSTIFQLFRDGSMDYTPERIF